MADAPAALQSLIEQTVRFSWYSGQVTAIGAHSTGWRISPAAGMVQIHDLTTTLEQIDHPPLTATSGSAFILDAQTSHCFTSTTARPGAIGCCRWASLDFHILGGISVLSLFSMPQIVQGALAQRVGDASAQLRALHDQPATMPISQVVKRTAIGLGLLSDLLEISAVNERGLQLLTHATRLQAVLGWIEEHLSEAASRGSLARIAQLSPSRFHALFQLVMHRSPMAYVAQRRMQRAQQLLMTTSQQVQDIAVAVGYADPFHFSRVFKQATGESPTEYRWRAQQWLQHASSQTLLEHPDSSRPASPAPGFPAPSPAQVRSIRSAHVATRQPVVRPRSR